MKNIKKVGILALTLALSAGALGTGVANAEEYKLNKSVKVYMNAYDAKSGVNSVNTYSAGNYNIYRSYNGMLNISTTSGPGAWINPNDSGSSSQTTESSRRLSVVPTNAETFKARARVNVRRDPSTRYARLGKVYSGQRIKGTRVGNWIKFTYNGRTAYTSARYYVNSNGSRVTSTKTTKRPSISSTSYSSKGSRAASIAKSKLGSRYVWGTSGPYSFDCSGLTSYAYRQLGIYLPRSSSAQSSYGRRVSFYSMKPGDLLFYARYGRVYHVAMYVGNGKVVHASTPKTGVIMSSTSERWIRRNLYTVKRIVN